MHSGTSFLLSMVLAGSLRGQAVPGTGASAPDTTARLHRCEQRLAGGEGAEDLLQDASLGDLHPLVGFRRLIKDHAPVGEVALVAAKEPGDRIMVRGRVVDVAGMPQADAMVYAYQTDARGWYAAEAPHVLVNSGDHRHARLFAYVRTDKDGTFTLHTVMPQGYPRSDLPAHIHVYANKSGKSGGTEFQFADDPRMTPARRERSEREGALIAAPEQSPGGRTYSYTLTIR